MGEGRPEENELEHIEGYVTSVAVLQVGERDFLRMTVDRTSAVGFEMKEVWTFFVYLDVGTTVALAQFQLLRDAMMQGWIVEIGYDGPPPEASQLRDTIGELPAYKVTVIPVTRIQELML